MYFKILKCNPLIQKLECMCITFYFYIKSRKRKPWKLKKKTLSSLPSSFIISYKDITIKSDLNAHMHVFNFCITFILMSQKH